MKISFRLLCLGLATLSSPSLAQDQDAPERSGTERPKSVFDGDYLTIGGGVGYSPSYSGSDDYSTVIFPLIRGSLGGVEISPRAAGISLNLLPEPEDGPEFSLGPAISLNRDRAKASKIKDPVVAAYGTLDTAVEIGPSMGVSFPGVFSRFDKVSLTADAMWDVAGAHNGMTFSPGVSYFAPINRSIAASVGVSTNWIDDDYADYYYSVPPTNGELSDADVLPGFQADGGFESVGVNMLLAFDLNGNVADGGLGLTLISSYSRLMGDAKRTPFTSERGSADQFFVALGLGYTF